MNRDKELRWMWGFKSQKKLFLKGWNGLLSCILLRTADEEQEVALGFGPTEISGGPGRSREVREVEMEAVDSSFERPWRSWYKRWFLREHFSVSGRSLHSAFMILLCFGGNASGIAGFESQIRL